MQALAMQGVVATKGAAVYQHVYATPPFNAVVIAPQVT